MESRSYWRRSLFAADEPLDSAGAGRQRHLRSRASRDEDRSGRRSRSSQNLLARPRRDEEGCMNQGLRALNRPLLFLVLFNLLPQIELRPLWTTAFAFLLVGYRLWLDYSGGRLPPRWALWAVQIGIGISI